VKPWPGIKHEIERTMKHDAGLRVGLLVDYYGMPPEWPGRTASALDPQDRAATIQDELRASLDPELRPRFFPGVLMHEFEAFVFVDVDQAAAAWVRPELVEPLRAIRSAFQSPEHINDSSTTAPSKRLIALIPGYQKPLAGAQAVEAIGLEKIRGACQCFDAWLTRLEAP
jgi:hypothetical protein